MDRILSLYPEYPVHLVHPCSKIPYRIEPLVEATAMRPFRVDPSWGRQPRLCQALCGRDARAPRKPSSHETVRPRARNCRSILAPLGVEGGPSVFWSIRVHWWFVFIKRLAIFSRMVRTRGRAITAHLSETKPVSLSNDPHRRGGRGPYLSETTPCAWWLETGS